VIGAAELERLARQRTVVVKAEPEAVVEVLGVGDEAVVRKTYHNRGLRWWQSLWRRSRAQREHDLLAAIGATGVPCLQPLGWSERRRRGGVDSSTLVTRFVPDCTTLKGALQATPRLPGDVRAGLATAMGALVAALHRRGFSWGTPMPRNVLLAGAPGAARLLVSDTPSCLATGRDLHGGHLARVDLFLGAFSPSRRRDWTRTERWRWLRGYAGGDRELARTLWRALQRRRPLFNALVRALAMATFTYVLGPRPAARMAPPHG
jgi:hypothetical protein